MAARRPGSTLFPYTTLFRSRRCSRPCPHRAEAAAVVRRLPTPRTHKACSEQRARDCEHELQDRKSTRLNSSHANTSYAVFCLKKKKTSSTDVPSTEGSVAAM